MPFVQSTLNIGGVVRRRLVGIFLFLSSHQFITSTVESSIRKAESKLVDS